MRRQHKRDSVGNLQLQYSSTGSKSLVAKDVEKTTLFLESNRRRDASNDGLAPGSTGCGVLKRKTVNSTEGNKSIKSNLIKISIVFYVLSDHRPVVRYYIAGR